MKTKFYFTLLSAIFISINAFSQIPTDGLQGYWSFSGNANDESGNNHNGTVNGATLISDRFGNPNSAYSFDGINDYIDFFESNNWCSSSHSISFWFKSQYVNGRDQFVIAKRSSCMGGSENYFEARISPDKNTLTIGWGKSGAWFNIDFEPNEWTNITYIIDGTKSSIFHNGSLIEEKTYTPYINSVMLRAGDHSCSVANDEYLGLLDDFGIWNRALSEEEVLDIFYENICSDTLINNTVINYVSNPEFESISPKIYLESTDSLTSVIGDCDSVIQNFTKYIFNPLHYTDTIITEVNDTIHVTIYDSTSVTDTLIIDVTITDINTSQINTIKVYPNPAKDVVFINNGSDYDLMNNYTIKISNVNGVKVFESKITQQQFEININDFGATGLYIIQIIDNTGKVIENRKLLLE